MENKSKDFFTIDLLHILKYLWKRVWIIAISGILTAAIGFSISYFAIAPKYSTSIMLYVNNSSFSLGNTNFSISASEISAAQSLVNTYCEILNNRTTLERVIDKADLSYSYKDLSGMITSSRANDTEIMRVTVTSEDPYEASKTVADSLSLNHMITNCRWCELVIDGGEPLFGIICDTAQGVRMSDTEIANPCKAQKEMMNLNVLDAVTLQVDHGTNNYNIYHDDSDNYRLCAFDNDNPYTFFPLSSISLSLSGCSPLVNKNGIVDRPHFDADLALKLKNVNTKLLVKNLKPYLNFLQTACLKVRIKKINQAVKKTQSVNSRFLIKDNEWNETTLQSEIGNKTTLTYLMKALSK